MGGDTPRTERTPLLGGVSVVTVIPPPVRNTPGDGGPGGGGHTLRESYDKIGLVADAFEGQEEPRCWGQVRSPSAVDLMDALATPFPLPPRCQLHPGGFPALNHATAPTKDNRPTFFEPDPASRSSTPTRP